VSRRHCVCTEEALANGVDGARLDVAVDDADRGTTIALSLPASV